MQPQETELEEFLHRIVPGCTAKWRGATAFEIEQIERLAPRVLPIFYRWFLMRMGRSMGPFHPAGLDLSAPKLISCYDESVFSPHPRLLMIGYESDEMMPFHLFYDLDRPMRDDALVIKRQTHGGMVYVQFETLREMIAWTQFVAFRIGCQPQCVSGLFVDEGEDVRCHLDPVMESLGFKIPFPTGSYCALYESTNAVMVTRTSPGEPLDIQSFCLGGHDAGRLRRILGEIATETPLELDIDEWDPSLY